MIADMMVALMVAMGSAMAIAAVAIWGVMRQGASGQEIEASLFILFLSLIGGAGIGYMSL